MKKAIFIILFALPVFLMVTISIAGRLIVMYIPTPVESVHFASGDGTEITQIEVGKDKTVVVTAVVLPELASNKQVAYTLINTNKDDPECEYDDETGILTGISYGYSRLLAVTDDKKLQVELEIIVRDKNVSAINLNKTELSLSLGESFVLVATIEPETAVNRNVSWSSSNPELVSVSALGKVSALAATPENEPVSITATAEDGGITAVCLVTVLNDLPAMAFYRMGEETPVKEGSEIIVRTMEINLMDYLLFDEDLIDLEEIKFLKIAGGGVINENERTVTFATSGSYINIQARVERDGVVIYSCMATIRYRQL